MRKETITTLHAQYVCDFRPEPAGGYTVTCPSLPPVVTYGTTIDEARTNAREAIELTLEVYRKDGRRIPPSDLDPRRHIQELVPVKLSRV